MSYIEGERSGRVIGLVAREDHGSQLFSLEDAQQCEDGQGSSAGIVGVGASRPVAD